LFGVCLISGDFLKAKDEDPVKEAEGDNVAFVLIDL
jgi:hypothetical protein